MKENEARAQRILDTAAGLFSRYGYDKTTVHDIAQEAGISKGAIYLHFESKDALFEALLLREIDVYRERWFALIEDDPQGGTIGGIYRNVIYALNAVPFMAALFGRDRHILGKYLDKPENLLQVRNAGGIRSEFIRLMQSVNVIRTDVNATHIAALMNLLSYGLAKMDLIVDPAADVSVNDMIETMALILDESLSPPDGADSEAGKAVLRQILAAGPQTLESLQAMSERTQNDVESA